MFSYQAITQALGYNNEIEVSKEDQEISKIVPLSECDSECGTCTTRFPSSVKFDEETSLFGTANPIKAHFIIPTSQSDWPSKAIGAVPGSVQNLVSNWASDEGEKIMEGSIKVSVSSLIKEDDHDDFINDVLILPYFVWVKNLKADDVASVLSKLMIILKNLPNSEKSELPAQIDGYEIKPDGYKAYLFLCSHKTKDKRCGVTATIMKKEFDLHLRDMDLLRDFGDDRPNGVEVAFVNHVGGHKYVANVMIYLKDQGQSIWLARLNPKNCKPVLDETVLNGKVWPEQVRSVNKICAINW